MMQELPEVQQWSHHTGAIMTYMICNEGRIWNVSVGPVQEKHFSSVIHINSGYKTYSKYKFNYKSRYTRVC